MAQVMTGHGGTHDGSTSGDEKLAAQLRDPLVRAWFDEHLPELRRSATGPRLLYGSLAIGFVLGLVTHIGGYALTRSELSEPFALIGDLLYALGFALWTGVVVTLFVQVIPDIKRRQFKQALDAYEATRHLEGGPDGGKPPAAQS
jgi:hypothetical protein